MKTHWKSCYIWGPVMIDKQLHTCMPWCVFRIPFPCREGTYVCRVHWFSILKLTRSLTWTYTMVAFLKGNHQRSHRGGRCLWRRSLLPRVVRLLSAPALQQPHLDFPARPPGWTAARRIKGADAGYESLLLPAGACPDGAAIVGQCGLRQNDVHW